MPVCVLRSRSLARVFVGAAAAFLLSPIAPATAKVPGATHCYGGWCHRVGTLEETDGAVGRRGFVVASYYDDCRYDRFNTCGLTSSGAVFEPDRPDNAASPIFPDGTVLLAYYPETKQAAVVRVTSAGPYRANRTLDVSRATAEYLGFFKKGIAELQIAVLKSPVADEARYKKLRVYTRVPGHMGTFASFEQAEAAAMARLKLTDLGQQFQRLEPRIEVRAGGYAGEILTDTGRAEVTDIAGPDLGSVEPQDTVRDAARLERVAALPASGTAGSFFLSGIAAIAEKAGVFVSNAKLAAAPEHRDDHEFSSQTWSFYDLAASFIRRAQLKARLRFPGEIEQQANLEPRLVKLPVQARSRY